MRMFKAGDTIRVRADSNSTYRGRTGAIQQELPEDTRGYWYLVRFESDDLKANIRLVEQDLTLVRHRQPASD